MQNINIEKELTDEINSKIKGLLDENYHKWNKIISNKL